MQGTVIAIKPEQDYCDIYMHEAAETYRAPLGTFKSDAELRVGVTAEFEREGTPSFFSPGKAKLTRLTPLDLSNEKVALTYDAEVPEHRVLQKDHNYLVAAEGGFERECRSALLEKAIECHANALFNLKLEVITRPGVKTALFRYTAQPVIVEGPKYHQEPGQKLTIPVKVARRNSPNEAMVRYIRVLLICFLFIAIPCIMALTQRGVIPSQLMGQIITAGLLVLCMILFLFISFHKRQSFILTLKKVDRG